MGKQLEGDFLEWPLNGQAAGHVRGQAIEQLLVLWHEGSKKERFPATWGDEVESAIVKLDGKKKQATLALRQQETLQKLQREQGQHGEYTVEFANYMIEAMPSEPYREGLRDLAKVEESMKARRQTVNSNMKENEFLFTISMFPRLGAGNSITGSSSTIAYPKEIERLSDVPGEIVSSEARYQAADKNIPARREERRPMSLPKFIDDQTSDREPIFLESTVFGPGHCGLQATFQTNDEAEARMLHDQLIPLGPIMLALTAATPIYKGFLADTDARWNQIANAVDDRHVAEVNDQSGEKNATPLPRRWECNTTYIANDARLLDSYQLPGLAINDEAATKLRHAGLDTLIARHFAHVFIRDPVMISKKAAKPDPNSSPVLQSRFDCAKDSAGSRSIDPDTNHFDALNGTVWPHVQLKLPPLNSPDMGWRVEFRAMEIQITDTENAAFCVFMYLVSRLVVKERCNFYLPLADVKENMDKAHARDAVLHQRFRWRVGNEIGDMSVDGVVNGMERFEGLIPAIKRIIRTEEDGVDAAAMRIIEGYLDLVAKRARGQLWTAARWMRELVRGHEAYQRDSVVSSRICYDLMARMKDLVIDEAARKGSGLF